jgi:hypothetical protein
MRRHKKKSRRHAKRKNPARRGPRVVVVTGNPHGGRKMKRRGSRKHRKHARKNPARRRRYGRRRHFARRRNPAGGGRLTFGKAIGYGLVGVVSAAAAFGIPEIMGLSGAMAYAPAVVLGGVGVAIAKKRPFLGLAIAAPALGGALAPLVTSKLLPAAGSASTPTTGAVEMGALGDRLGNKRMAALIQGMSGVGAGMGALEARPDTLTRGY